MKRGLFYLIGAASLAVALMSVVDMFVPKPYDGITPGESNEHGIEVLDVAPASGAEKAGIASGDRIVGIGEKILLRQSDAAAEVLRHPIGAPVDYLVRHGEKVAIVKVVPGAILFGNHFYAYDIALGLLFFLIGSFVLSSRPDDESAKVFFLLCDLFLVFLACRLRPSSYYWVDYFVQNAGTVALFLLPAVFLHFFLIFPERKHFNLLGEDDPYAEPPTAFRIRLDRWANQRRYLFALIYILPPIAYLIHLAANKNVPQLLSGAPAVNWVLLGNYLVLGLLALSHSWIRATDERRRRQILPVLLGTLFGTAPFILFSVILPSLTRDDHLVFYGTIPLILIPLTFGYAIARYQVLNIKLVIRKGILYALTTALVTALYAIAIAAANALLKSSVESIAGSSSLAFVLGVSVVLLFDPIRRRMQEPIDRVFFRDRVNFAAAIKEMSEAVRGEISLDRIKEILADRVISVTKASGGWLCLPAGEQSDLICEAKGANDEPPPSLAIGGALATHLRSLAVPRKIDALQKLEQDLEGVDFLRTAAASGVRLAVPLVYRERLMGVLFLKAKLSDEEYGGEELDVLATLANQAAVALETARLHDEATRQVELARDLEIAREIQMSLFPRKLPAPPGIEIHADSIPARVVGGDFYDVLDFGGISGRPTEKIGLLLGDVAGKSIPAALLMVASREILYAAAHLGADPATVFREANQRIYSIKRRMFVALGYYILDPDSLTLSYSIAGMPAPIICPAGGRASYSIEPPLHRIPLGALKDVPYDARTFQLRGGDLVFVYSDGLTETLDPSGEPFGEERLSALLTRYRDEPLPALGQRLISEIRRFADGADPYDDMTFLFLRIDAGATAKPNPNLDV